MSNTDELLAHAETYAASFEQGDLPQSPARRVAVLACMDARLNPYALLGLREGDAHIIRNAGGVVTDDAIRSLAISQRLLGTTEAVLIQHTGCGLLGLDEEQFKLAIRTDVGVEPAWSVEAFTDLDESVRGSIARLQDSPFIPHKNVRGFVYDVQTGALREVR